MASALNLDLLSRACAAVNSDADFKKLGTADMIAGIKVDNAAFTVTFEAFEVAGVEAIAVDELRDADFYLELPAQAWQRYLAGRKAGRAPTLSVLDLETDGGILRGAEPLKTLKFERYIGTLQAFFDKGAALA